MDNLKCFIDVNFTIEEDLARFTNKDRQDFIANRELMTDLFKQDLLEKLEYFSGYIKNLNATISFENNDK